MKDRVTVLPVAEVDVALTKYLEQNNWGQVSFLAMNVGLS